MKLTRQRLEALFLLVVILNYALFALSVIVLGGDALSGRVEAGRYFVGNHGKLTEVSRTAWIWSALQTWALLAIHGGTFAIALVITALRNLRKLASRHTTRPKG